MNYPYNIISPPIFVVSSVTTSNGIGGVNKSDYRYKDLIFHRAGKGLLGFKNITINNEVLGTTTEVYNDVNIQYATSYQTKQLTKLNSTGETLSEQDVTTTFVDKSTNGYFGKRFSPQVEKSIDINYLTGAASETDNTYDNYGNITTVIHKSGSWSGSSVNTIETATTTTAFGIHNTPVPNDPESSIVQNQITGQPAVSKETDFGYDTKGNIASKTEFAGKPLAISSSYTYDNFGNMTQSVVSASGINSRVSKSTYDSQGRFV